MREPSIAVACLLVMAAVTVTDGRLGCTCPFNSCTQDEADIGFCNYEVSISQSYQCSSSIQYIQRSRLTVECERICERRVTSTVWYRVSVIVYQTCYRYVMGCQRRCCSGHILIDGICEPVCFSGCLNGGRCIYPEVCSCPSSWQGYNCGDDVNECAQQSACHSNAICTNTPGSFSCACNDGYTGDGTTCADVDECVQQSPCHLNAMCTNTPGSFTCACNNGYTGDGITCTDVDECEEFPCNSNAICTNTPGSFTCACNDGYTGDGTTCIDIDECEESPCHSNAICTNTLGSHTCACNNGYTGDGTTCTDETSTIAETEQSMSETVATSSFSLQLFSSSAAVGEREQGGAGSTTDPLQITVIAGVVAGVVLFIVLTATAFLALVCYKMKVSKRHTLDNASEQNGNNHYVNQAFMASSSIAQTYAVPMAPLPSEVPEYTEVSDVHNRTATSHGKVSTLSTRVVNPLVVSHEEENEYDYVREPIIPMSSYQYVSTLQGRQHLSTVIPNPHSPVELEDVYEEMSFTTPKYENVQFAPPASEVEGLYGQLAERKCIEIPRQSVRTMTLLGSGQFGNVFKGEWATPRRTEEVALKMLREGHTEDDKVKFLQEAAIMAQFRHPHIIRLLGAVTVDEPILIVIELLNQGNLEDYLQTQRSAIFAELAFQLLRFCREISDGMKYLSNKGFVHRDLAARNILLNKKVQCKIADFGLSRDVSENVYYTATTGKIPLRWTAPEALFFMKFSTKSDVWSYGMLMYEIWSIGEKPFPTMSLQECVTKLQDDPHYVQPPPPGCPKAIYQQMVLCWNSDHHGRPTFAYLLETLSGPTHELLRFPEESLREVKNQEMAAQIGATVHASLDLYLDLQRYYYDTK